VKFRRRHAACRTIGIAICMLLFENLPPVCADRVDLLLWTGKTPLK
jgi:hypothetical protein